MKSNESSLSPVKEGGSRCDEGPIKIFKRENKSRERSDSSSSVLNLQPTLIARMSGQTSKNHLVLHPRVVVSDESMQKRASLNAASANKSTTPRSQCLSFHQQCRQSNAQLLPHNYQSRVEESAFESSTDQHAARNSNNASGSKAALHKLI